MLASMRTYACMHARMRQEAESCHYTYRRKKIIIPIYRKKSDVIEPNYRKKSDVIVPILRALEQGMTRIEASGPARDASRMEEGMGGCGEIDGGEDCVVFFDDDMLEVCVWIVGRARGGGFECVCVSVCAAPPPCTHSTSSAC